jgi:hypothetical protein
MHWQTQIAKKSRVRQIHDEGMSICMANWSTKVVPSCKRVHKAKYLEARQRSKFFLGFLFLCNGTGEVPVM